MVHIKEGHSALKTGKNSEKMKYIYCSFLRYLLKIWVTSFMDGPLAISNFILFLNLQTHCIYQQSIYYNHFLGALHSSINLAKYLPVPQSRFNFSHFNGLFLHLTRIQLCRYLSINRGFYKNRGRYYFKTEKEIRRTTAGTIEKAIRSFCKQNF